MRQSILKHWTHSTNTLNIFSLAQCNVHRMWNNLSTGACVCVRVCVGEWVFVHVLCEVRIKHLFDVIRVWCLKRVFLYLFCVLILCSNRFHRRKEELYFHMQRTTNGNTNKIFTLVPVSLLFSVCWFPFTYYRSMASKRMCLAYMVDTSISRLSPLSIWKNCQFCMKYTCVILLHKFSVEYASYAYTITINHQITSITVNMCTQMCTFFATDQNIHWKLSAYADKLATMTMAIPRIGSINLMRLNCIQFYFKFNA